MNLLLVIIIAVSLSMDTFSLSLAYGTLGFSRKENFLLAFIVGLFHFFMPLIGMVVGKSLLSFIKIDADILVFLILLFIGVQMICNFFKEEIVKKMKYYEYFLFALAVSIDSFSVGIGLFNITKNYIFSSFLFSLFSFLFTYFGLLFGNKIRKSIGKVSCLFGGIVLIIIGLFYLF